MTPREVIAAYLAVLNQMQHQIDLEYDKMAGALVDRLSDAGIVMVPRKATEAMVEAGRKDCQDDQSHYGDATARAVWNTMIAEATKP